MSDAVDPAIYSHIDDLRDWIRSGNTEALARCRGYLAMGLPCVATSSDSGAAITFVGIRWNFDHVDETAALMREYIDAGQIKLDETMVMKLDYFNRKPVDYEENHGLLPLVAAMRNRNLDATLVLVRAGAVEVTDFAEYLAPGALDDAQDPRQAGFELYVRRHWSDLVHVHARINEAIMSRRIQVTLASGPGQDPAATAPAATAPRRRAGV